MRMEASHHQHHEPQTGPESATAIGGAFRGKRRLARHAADKALRRLRRRGVNDRGTVLLMVLGVLAMLAIIAVAYAAIGTADRTTSAAAVKQSREDDQSRKIADILAGVLAKDVAALYPQQDRAASGPGTFRRELYDFPGVDPMMTSYEPRLIASEAGAGQYRFNPEGTINQLWSDINPSGATSTRDPRHASDPFLAASEPVNLRYNRTNARQAGNGSADEAHLDNVDWPAISNFAPSGNFVNLFNLRNNFRAESGFSEGSPPSPGAAKSRLSDHLSRFNEQGDLEVVDAGPNPNRKYFPATFTNEQFFAFRPMYDDLASQTDPARAANHVGYQWGDADGDGFADSRWFELTDLLFDLPRSYDQSQQTLPADGRLRYFVAARCIDLSGLINVNTAGDFGAPPQEFPSPVQVKPLAGFTPGDVDLYRVLRMTDVPSVHGSLDCYANDLAVPAQGPNGDYSQYTLANAPGIGTAAYMSLWYTRTNTSTAPSGFFNPATVGTILNNSAAKWDWFDRVGYTPEPASTSASRRTSGGVFGLLDEQDLRTFNGINDSSSVSTLERVMDGRLGGGSEVLGPMRSNRPRPLEMAGRSEFLNLSGGGIIGTVQSYKQSLLQSQVDVRRLLTTINGSRPLYDRPEVIDGAGVPSIAQSVQSDATQLIAGAWYDFANNAPYSAQQVVDDGGLAYQTQFNAAIDNVRTLFRHYADALMPYTDARRFPEAWDPVGASGHTIARGLSYGGRAELAYILAAHMAINLRDAVDSEERSIQLPGVSLSAGPYPASTETIRDDCRPTSVCLDLTQGAVQSQGSLAYQFPRLNLDPTGGAGATSLARLTNDPNRIISVSPIPSGNGAGQKKLTMFGIEPQPFISQVTSMAIWTDAPPNFGGDTERSTPAGPGQQEIKEPITIDVGVDMLNQDFVCEVLAVQLTNPFDTDIVLESKLPNGESFYYLEYAGRYYRLTPQDPDSPNGLKVTPGDIGVGGPQTGLNYADRVLKAGESRVFFATYPPTAKDVEKRFNDLRNAFNLQFPGGPTTTFKLKDFADHQFGREHCHMALIDPGTGLPVRAGSGAAAPFTLADIHAKNEAITYPSNTGNPIRTNLVAGGGLMSSNDPERHVVNLWRVMRTPPGSTITGGDAYTAASPYNDPLNDYLVDRIRDPQGWIPTAGQPLPSSFGGSGTLAEAHIKQNGSGLGTNIEVDGTDAGDGGFSNATNAKDNTGFTLASFSRISRMSKGSSGITLPKGAMPPWCMETKSDNFYVGSYGFTTSGANGANITQTFSLNGVDNNRQSASDGLGNRGTFTNSTDSHFSTFGQFITETSIQGSTTPTSFIDDDLSKPVQPMPLARTDNSFNSVDMSREDASASNPPFRPYLQSAVEIRRIGAIADNTGAITSRTNQSLFSRVGDFLLPLAVGPTFDPARLPFDPSNPTNRMASLEANWVTLAEALAMASDYYNPSIGSPMGNLFHNVARTTLPPHDSSSNPAVPVLDRGQLVLNAWVPYLEVTGDGSFTPPQPGSPTSGDPVLGNGIPLALNIVDMFRVAGVPADQTHYRQLGRTAGYGSSTKAIPGKVSANTAPLAALRALPLVSPEPDLSGWIAARTDVATTGSTTAPTIGSTAGGAPVALWDYATPGNTWDIATTLEAYRQQVTLQTRATAVSPVEVSFANDRQGIAATPAGLTGREDATQVLGLRSSPGFKSLGELMMADIAKSSDSALGPVRDRSNSITALGYDNKALGSVTGTTVENSLDAAGYKASGTSTEVPNELVDEFGEKIAIFNALSNTATVRSDLFCIWFLIHGYSPEDVQVEDGRPMVPSVQRRYMMILDRSNVQTARDKPRVVMLKELPLR